MTVCPAQVGALGATDGAAPRAASGSVDAAEVAAMAAEGYDPSFERLSGPALGVVEAPEVTGVAQVGRVVTADPGTWSRKASYAYAWRVTGESAVIGSDQDLTVPAAAVGKTVTVTVTATAVKGGAVATADSDPSRPVAQGVLAGVKKPVLTGTPKVGKKLKTTPAKTRPQASATFTWLRNGSILKKTVKGSYTVAKGDAGKQISVRITYTKAGYATRTVTSKAVKVAKPKRGR